jgi:two-component system sensor histidine kinase/response regulator
MTNFINSLFKHSETDAITKKNIDKEIRQVNLIRSFMITGLAIPIALILSFTYSQDSNGYTVSFIDWRRSILDLNFTIVVISAVLFVLTLVAWSKPDYTFLNKQLPHFILLVMAVWGTICSIYNQNVSTSIVTFLLICFVSSISLLIHPLRLFVYLIIIYLIFFIGVSNTQHDSSVLFSNVAIGLVTLVACLGLAMIQWRNNITKIQQKMLIKSQKKELELNYKQLLITSEELKKANQTKDKFFSILAHDLRGPISSTLALTHFLEESIFDNDENERKRLFKLLQSSLATSAKLLENILLWSTSQTGNIKFKPVKINLFECIQSNIDFLKIVAAQKDIKVRNLVNMDIIVFADADMLNTIFRNLISNAIKFTRNFGSVDVISTVQTSEVSEKKSVSVSVKDNGVGMSEKLLKSLFQIEKQAIKPGTNKEMGTGLGLVLCKEFIEKHDGTISVESTEEVGSTFTVTLPL